MECINHNSPAKGMCLGCGKFLCTNCIQLSKNGKIVCSAECASYQERQESAMKHLAEKNLGMSFASAFSGYLLGLIFLASAFFMRVPEVRIFLLAAGLGVLCMGAFYHINAVKKLKSKAS